MTDLTAEGEGIAHVDAFALFIKDAVPGDTVECRVMKLKKNYGWAKLLSVVTPSPDRIPADCPVARACGGCQIREMEYQAALRFKQRKIAEDLKRIGGFDAVTEGDESPALSENAVLVRKTLGMQDPLRYRNKAQVPFGIGKDGRLLTGFYAGRTHDIVEADDCILMPEIFSDVVKAVKRHVQHYKIPVYREETHEGLIRHVLIRKGFSTGELMVTVVVNGDALPFGEVLAFELKNLAAKTGDTRFVSLSVNQNRSFGNAILGPVTKSIYGPAFIADELDGVRFLISPNSFYQVNPVMTEVLYKKALEFAALTGGETVWDLYCGIGTISLFLARRAKKVYGVEIVPQAVEDARRNAAENGFVNTEFFTGKAEEVLPAWREANPSEAVDVIVVDPPRKGCDPECLETMLRISPARIVYVSCDPATLSRDLKILCAGGYRIQAVQPVDMFPGTVHVETVCCLYHQKKDFISVPYEPKDDDYLKQHKTNFSNDT